MRPLAPDFSGKKLDKGRPILLVAAQHQDFRTSGIDPILSPCAVKDYISLGSGPSRMKTDCDSDHGSSGGVYLFRDSDGKIYAKAIEITGKDLVHSKIPNHAPYDNETNFTGTIVIDQSFLSWYSK